MVKKVKSIHVDYDMPSEQLKWNLFSNKLNSIIDEAAELVSNIIKDGIEEIKLSNCESTIRAITPIAEKIAKFKNPVNISILYIIA